MLYKKYDKLTVRTENGRSTYAFEDDSFSFLKLKILFVFSTRFIPSDRRDYIGAEYTFFL